MLVVDYVVREKKNKIQSEVDRLQARVDVIDERHEKRINRINIKEQEELEGRTSRHKLYLQRVQEDYERGIEKIKETYEESRNSWIFKYEEQVDPAKSQLETRHKLLDNLDARVEFIKKDPEYIKLEEKYSKAIKVLEAGKFETESETFKNALKDSKEYRKKLEEYIEETL